MNSSGASTGRSAAPVKVLYVINGLGTGGAERSLAEMLPLLPAHGVEATVAVLRRRAEGVEAAVRSRGQDVRFLGGRGVPGAVLALRRLIATQRPDLVHTTIFESDVAGRIAAVGGPPVLTSLVNTSYDPVRVADSNVRPLRLRLVRALDGWTARHLTAHFHAISTAVREAAIDALGIAADRITVIPRGRDPERLGVPSAERRRRGRAMLDLHPDAEVLLHVGRQEYQKGQQFLFEAIAQLAARPRLMLVVAGRQGNATRNLEELLAADPQLRGRVRMLGHREDVPDLLAAADLFVFPSLYEGLGGAVLEAMALGLPVVASDIPALRETLEPAGNAFFVRPGSSALLAETIGRALDDLPAARAMGERGRARFASHYTTESITAKMASLYRQATGVA